MLERMSIQKCNCFKSLEKNAELDHLALPTMLSALKYDWGILALFVVVNRSPPNHTRLTVKIRNEDRAAVTDDKKSKLRPFLGCIENYKMGRENQQACPYTAFK